uniref:Uncharacterized protein n=1 Tax=Caenorhabditis tropicalis TaxID=1561998 RepID=A0A1I7U420_9PELO
MKSGQSQGPKDQINISDQERLSDWDTNHNKPSDQETTRKIGLVKKTMMDSTTSDPPKTTPDWIILRLEQGQRLGQKARRLDDSGTRSVATKFGKLAEIDSSPILPKPTFNCWIVSRFGRMTRRDKKPNDSDGGTDYGGSATRIAEPVTSDFFESQKRVGHIY